MLGLIMEMRQKQCETLTDKEPKSIDYLVKFVKGDYHHMKVIIYNTTYFPSVFHLNDFNELFLEHIIDFQSSHYSSHLNGNPYSFLGKKDNQAQEKFNHILKYLHRHGIDGCDPKKYCEMAKYLMLRSMDNNSKYSATVNYLKYHIYSLYGIASFSDVTIFDDDSALLMFAHYANNLDGFALVYECLSTTQLYPVEYVYKTLKPPMDLKEFDQYLKDPINETHIKCITQKSQKWSYEKEYRFIRNLSNIRSNISLSNDCLAIRLKYIMHTDRVNQDKLSIVKSIFPKDQVICLSHNTPVILKERTSYVQVPCFSVQGQSVLEFLKDRM